MTVSIENDGTVSLKITRDFQHPPEKIFEAWLKPELLIQWMGPTNDVYVSNVETNPYEGGTYHMQFNEPNNQINKLNGVYKIITRYSRLVFTWVWEKPTEGAGEETLVSLDFIAINNGTRLTLLHQNFSTQELADRHHWGWDETLLKLERKALKILKTGV